MLPNRVALFFQGKQRVMIHLFLQQFLPSPQLQFPAATTFGGVVSLLVLQQEELWLLLLQRDPLFPASTADDPRQSKETGKHKEGSSHDCTQQDDDASVCQIEWHVPFVCCIVADCLQTTFFGAKPTFIRLLPFYPN